MGLRSLVVESAESLRVSGYGIVISANAWRALDAVGVAHALRQHNLQIQGLQIFPIGKDLANTTILLQGEGKCGRQEVRCVKRKSLLETLEELPPGTVRFSSKVVSIQESGYFKLLDLADGSTIKAKNTKLNNLSVSTIKVRWPLDILSGNIHKGNVCVAGDAFHPMTPDIGQGACLALEDAVVLTRCLAEALKISINGQKAQRKTDEEKYERINKALEKYAKVRQWRSFLIASTSCITGILHQSNGLVIGFLREKFLSRILMNAQLKIADFDCGKLQCT